MIFVIMTVEAVFVRGHARSFIAPFVDSLTAILETRFLLRLTKHGSPDSDDSSSTHAVGSLRSQSPTLDEETLYESEPEPDSSSQMLAWPPRVLDGLSPFEFAIVSAMRHGKTLPHLPVRYREDEFHMMTEIQWVRAPSVLTPEKLYISGPYAEVDLATGVLKETLGVPPANALVDQLGGNAEFHRNFVTADGNPPKLDIPPAPLGGWYLPSGQIESWEMLEQDQPCSLATVAGDSVDPPHEARLIHSNLADLLNVQRYSFHVGAAEPRIKPAGPHPNVFLITGLSEVLNNAIQRQQVVSAPGITFFIYPPHPQPWFSGFMGTIVNLGLEDSVDGDAAALEVIRTAVMVNKRFTRAVFSHRDTLPIGICPEDIVDDLRDSIAIRPVELRSADRGHRIGYRVHVAVHTTDPGAYQAIRRAFRFTKVFVTKGVLGTVRNEFKLCRICRSIDHSAPLCPYPTYPKWRGPTAATIMTVDEAAREGNSLGGSGGDDLP
ncbi:hypothetical protein B0H14DRAFT_2920621 [Mycena olivaceomarginata]|nr:hypothetical protein B0H14DRAFT_2920621 [Mycena olivaceomarginata]